MSHWTNERAGSHFLWPYNIILVCSNCICIVLLVLASTGSIAFFYFKRQFCYVKFLLRFFQKFRANVAAHLSENFDVDKPCECRAASNFVESNSCCYSLYCVFSSRQKMGSRSLVDHKNGAPSKSKQLLCASLLFQRKALNIEI